MKNDQSDMANQSGAPSLADQLRIRRAKIAKEMTHRIKKLDRQIALLEGSDAEKIVHDATEALYED